jgi:predicted thioesterase
MVPEGAASNTSGVQYSASGLFLCEEPCRARDACRNGVLAAKPDGANHSVVYELECPDEFRQMPGRAHASWTAGVMSEICGQASLRLGVVAFTGTVTTRYLTPVPVGERLVGRVVVESYEGRKLFVRATLTAASTGAELATAHTTMIAPEARALEARFGEVSPI